MNQEKMMNEMKQTFTSKGISKLLFSGLIFYSSIYLLNFIMPLFMAVISGLAVSTTAQYIIYGGKNNEK